MGVLPEIFGKVIIGEGFIGDGSLPNPKQPSPVSVPIADKGKASEPVKE